MALHFGTLHPAYAAFRYGDGLLVSFGCLECTLVLRGTACCVHGARSFVHGAWQNQWCAEDAV